MRTYIRVRSNVPYRDELEANEIAARTKDINFLLSKNDQMSLRTIFMLTIECPECGKTHKFSVNGVVEKGTIYCGCGKTIIVDNVNRFVEKIDELERPSPKVALSTEEEKKEEKEKVEKPKEEKQKAEKPKTEKPKAAKVKEEKPKAEKPKTVKPKAAEAKEEKPKEEKPKAKRTRKKKSTKEEAKK